jgi:RimJ/RimL family protein N-acetyltransferase
MKYEVLDDGTNVLLREPVTEDQQSSLEFFLTLPEEDRRYLRIDVTRPGVVERRLEQAASGEVYRLWAFVGDEIAADGSLEFSGERWGGHLGEIRVIVGREYQRRGLGTLLMRKLFSVAEERQLEKIVMKMLEPQTSIRAACEKLGFRVDAVIPDYVKDQEGETQSLVIMTCTLDQWFKEMKDFYQEKNWDG